MRDGHRDHRAFDLERGRRRRRLKRAYSRNVAIAVSPLFTTTLFDFAAPLDGLHVTECLPGASATRIDDDVPLEAPFTENAQLPPIATATSVPLPPPPDAGGGAGGGGGGGGGGALFGADPDGFFDPD